MGALHKLLSHHFRNLSKRSKLCLLLIIYISGHIMFSIKHMGTQSLSTERYIIFISVYLLIILVFSPNSTSRYIPYRTFLRTKNKLNNWVQSLTHQSALMYQIVSQHSIKVFGPYSVPIQPFALVSKSHHITRMTGFALTRSSIHKTLLGNKNDTVRTKRTVEGH